LGRTTGDDEVTMQTMALPSREFLISEVDREFALQHPEAPRRLNPNDPSQAHLVEQWNAMYHEFLSNMVDSHFFRFFPDAPRQLDPNDPSQATLVAYWNDLRDAIEKGTSQYNWDTPPESADAATPTPGESTPPADPGEKPELHVHMDESQFKEFIHAWLESEHYMGDTAEVLGYVAQIAGAGEESAVVWLGEALGPVGTIASTIVVLWATVHAFGTGRRLQEQQGFCYGVMWQVCGHPNEEKGFIDWFNDSADELRESFYDGVAAGREKAGTASVHNRVMLLIAYYQANGHDLESARSMVLNDLWHQIRESDAGRDYLTWPVPTSMGS
jgi:hypothetical protein